MSKPNTNTYKINDDVCEIHTIKGDVIYVDYYDFENSKLREHCWYVTSRGYVASRINGKITYIHRLIMKPGKLQVDHINHNKLDNRRLNLRVVTNLENHHIRSRFHCSLQDFS